ncbi:MAG: class I SAM-dependent methyltransferase [Symploca sp. SIO3E6]|nr:class I SAM-dependent methyltransferase [Caldora sp. SIO3E6]
MQNSYTEDFYNYHAQEVRHSAEQIIPLILEKFPCNKIVDVGCGDGTWLKVFKELGAEEILGFDGDYVTPNILVIPQENFVACQLNKPLKIQKVFDLVVSLEVAEHLSDESAEIFIDSLTKLGKVILFSAAIPDQGGVNHINEQWPEYWVNLFQKKDYVVLDWIRPKIWNNNSVAYYYRQNILMFVEKNYLKNNNSLVSNTVDIWKCDDSSCISVVHPGLYIDTKSELRYVKNELEKATNPQKISLLNMIKLFPKVIISSMKRRINFFGNSFTS